MPDEVLGRAMPCALLFFYVFMGTALSAKKSESPCRHSGTISALEEWRQAPGYAGGRGGYYKIVS